MRPADERGGETVAIASGDLQIVFVRTGDRFSHRIAHLASSDTPLLASVEGQPDDPWPSSPPWQELHVERRGELQVALLVGRAGHSHWSMSVEPELAADGFLFDIACRTSGEVGFLGSTYRLAGGAMPVLAANGIHLGGGNELCVLTGEIELSGAGENRTARVRPLPRSDTSPQTIRWQYRLSRIPPKL